MGIMSSCANWTKSRQSLPQRVSEIHQLKPIRWSSVSISAKAIWSLMGSLGFHWQVKFGLPTNISYPIWPNFNKIYCQLTFQAVGMLTREISITCLSLNTWYLWGCLSNAVRNSRANTILVVGSYHKRLSNSYRLSCHCSKVLPYIPACDHFSNDIVCINWIIFYILSITWSFVLNNYYEHHGQFFDIIKIR